MKKRRNDLSLLIGLIVLGIVLGKIQTLARNSGKIDPISDVARLLVQPAAKGISSTANATTDFFGAVGTGRRLAVENERLRAIEKGAETYQSDVDNLQQEVEELRKLGGWQASGGREKIPADVIGYFPHESRLTLDVGTDKGISRGMPVATYEGLIGRIETVDKSSSQVVLITSPSSVSRISAVVDGEGTKPGTAGLLRGDGQGGLSIELADPAATVIAGERVTTSGFSQEIPRGIAIGRIVEVQDDKAFGRRTATIKLSANLGSLREVLVIK